jgi:hypothetical protein
MTYLERALETQAAKDREQRERNQASSRRMKAEMQNRDKLEYSEGEEDEQ